MRIGLLLGAFALAATVAWGVRAGGDAGAGPAGAVPGPPAAAAVAEPGKGAKPEPPRGWLCDDKWIGGFETIQLGDWKYDGRKIQDYDPAHPEEPWYIRGERYMGSQHEKNMMYKFLGRFWDRKETDKFYNLVVAEQRFWRHFTPQYRPSATASGAYLASDQYTCTIDRNNPVIDPANWIVELDGYLFVGDATECKGGQFRKVVTVVDCSGKKNLVTDKFTAPCDVGPVSSCIVRMSPGIFGIQQDYSGSSLGRHLSFKVYDPAKRRTVFSMSQIYDRSVGEDVFVKVTDVDNDGVPELETLTCNGDDCRRTALRKWNGRAYEAAATK